MAGLREYRCGPSLSLAFVSPTWVDLTRIVNPFGIDITKPFVPVDTSYSSDTYFAVPSDANVPGTIRGALWVDQHEKIYKSAATPIRDEPD